MKFYEFDNIDRLVVDKNYTVNPVNIEYGITHAGDFHADDVFSTALLLMLNPNIKIARVNAVPAELFENTIVYDIGDGKYDHHCDTVKRHNNKYENKYAAFGLLWDDFGMNVVGNNTEIFEEIRDKFVVRLDAADNGEAHDAIAEMIYQFNSEWDATDSEDEMYFIRAVETAYQILSNKIRHYTSLSKSKNMVYDLIKSNPINKHIDSRIVVLNKFVPFLKTLENTDIMYVIYPSNRGGFGIRAMPITAESFECKKFFPESWRGLRGEDLIKVCKIDTMDFCHASGFFASALSLADAIKAAEIALNA